MENEDRAEVEVEAPVNNQNIDIAKLTLSRDACVSAEKLDTFLTKLKNFQEHFSSNCKEMTGSLKEIEAQYNEQLRDGLNTLKVTSENNRERFVLLSFYQLLLPFGRNTSLQKQLDILKKGSKDARQLAGAYRMSHGGAPSRVGIHFCLIWKLFIRGHCRLGHIRGTRK